MIAGSRWFEDNTPSPYIIQLQEMAKKNDRQSYFRRVHSPSSSAAILCHGGRIYYDPAAFVTPVVKLLTNPALAATLGSNGRKRVEEYFNWQRVGNDFIALYDKTLSPGNSAVTGDGDGRSQVLGFSAGDNLGHSFGAGQSLPQI